MHSLPKPVTIQDTQQQFEWTKQTYSSVDLISNSVLTWTGNKNSNLLFTALYFPMLLFYTFTWTVLKCILCFVLSSCAGQCSGQADLHLNLSCEKLLSAHSHTHELENRLWGEITPCYECLRCLSWQIWKDPFFPLTAGKRQLGRGLV